MKGKKENVWGRDVLRGKLVIRQVTDAYSQTQSSVPLAEELLMNNHLVLHFDLLHSNSAWLQHQEPADAVGSKINTSRKKREEKKKYISQKI